MDDLFDTADFNECWLTTDEEEAKGDLTVLDGVMVGVDLPNLAPGLPALAGSRAAFADTSVASLVVDFFRTWKGGCDLGDLHGLAWPLVSSKPMTNISQPGLRTTS